MVQSLEEYVVRSTKAYQPAVDAIQSQLNALPSQLKTANEQINRNYAQQQSTLNRNRNIAAETASMQAAGSGGSFGGAANIANRKYYDQQFVPAQTQLQTNQANDLSQAKRTNEDQRLNLTSQLANMRSQYQQQALQQYYADLEAEKQRQFQAEQEEKNRKAQLRAARASAAAASSPSQYLLDAIKKGMSNQGVNKSKVDFLSWVKNYSNYNDKTKNDVLNLTNFLVNKKTPLPGKFGDAWSGGVANYIQKTKEYKDYLKWRNS